MKISRIGQVDRAAMRNESGQAAVGIRHYPESSGPQAENDTLMKSTRQGGRADGRSAVAKGPRQRKIAKSLGPSIGKANINTFQECNMVETISYNVMDNRRSAPGFFFCLHSRAHFLGTPVPFQRPAMNLV